ncbi:MAG: glutathione S-transferase family protein [Proteobacteria bacterium]|nr:glutathione S-transferase family protein [Pseudomonadota bacterium]
MTALKLIIANKNYSSWSLRPWLLMKQFGIEFEEELLPLDTDEFRKRTAGFSANGCVPVLLQGERIIWDTLAIVEYLAELFPEKNLWPEDVEARAFARSIAAEMHSGFSALRNEMPMNIRGDHRDFSCSDAVTANIDRIFDIWQTCRDRFGAGGDMLFGDFSAADAFYAPVIWRFRTYGIAAPGTLANYMETMIALPAMQEWKVAGEAEPWTVAVDEI